MLGNQYNYTGHKGCRVRRPGASQSNTCGACNKPVDDNGTLCWDCIREQHGLRDLLSRLTSAVIGAETGGKKPLRVVIRPGEVGRGRSTVWDTPSGEASNIPRMLREAGTRQTAFTDGAGTRTRGGDVPSVRVDYRSASRMRVLETALAGLARDMTRVTSTVPSSWTWGGIARWVDANMASARLLESAPAHLAALRAAVLAAEAHVDRPPTRRYLGPCDTGGCGGEYLAAPDAVEAVCQVCGGRVVVSARRDELLDRAREMWLTAVDIERLTAELGERVPDSTVDSWRRRGQIPFLAGDPARYLLGDVLGRLEARKRRAS